MLPVVQSSPGWAAEIPDRYGSPPKRPSDYTAYLRALVLRYGPAGSFWDEHPELPRRPQREWQIWNEPHIDFYWSTKGRRKNSWAPGYARLLKESKRAIEAIDPGATIVLAGLADFAWDHLDRLNRFKIARHFDVAALNLFTSRPKLLIKGVKRFRQALRRGGEGRKPLWITETTWPAGKERVPLPGPLWQRAWYTTDTGMAGRLRGAYRLAARFSGRLGIGRMYWYTWSSAYRDDDLFDYAGLVRYRGGEYEPRPALAAYAARGPAPLAAAPAPPARARAAASGSAASRIARSTTTRSAPAATTWSRLSSLMPPMANQGRSPRHVARRSARTRARRPASPPW